MLSFFELLTTSLLTVQSIFHLLQPNRIQNFFQRIYVILIGSRSNNDNFSHQHYLRQIRRPNIWDISDCFFTRHNLDFFYVSHTVYLTNAFRDKPFMTHINSYINTLRTGLLNCLNARSQGLTFRHRASCIQGQAFHYSPENAFYILNQQIYFII